MNETVIREDVRFVITAEGLLSLALVQLPGISLGILGIMKAGINHGMTSQGAKDSLRSSLFQNTGRHFSAKLCAQLRGFGVSHT